MLPQSKVCILNRHQSCPEVILIYIELIRFALHSQAMFQASFLQVPLLVQGVKSWGEIF